MKNATTAACIASALLLSACAPKPNPRNGPMKTLGLIGGTSWRSTVEYYSYINQAVNDTFGNNTNPPLVVYNLNQYQVHRLQEKNNWDSIAVLLTDAAMRLQAAGADGIMFCANTPHKVFDKVQDQLSVPVLHIADATAMAIRQKGLHKVGLIGTIYTMEDDYISGRLKSKYSIETLVPEEKSVREELHRIIHEELTYGIFKPESKAYVLQAIGKLKERGAEGIILGCTEFPLIIEQKDLNIPAFNTTLLHTQMGVHFILDKGKQ